MRLPNSSAPPECYPAGEDVVKKDAQSAEKNIASETALIPETGDHNEYKEPSSPSPQKQNVAPPCEGKSKPIVLVTSPSKPAVKKSDSVKEVGKSSRPDGRFGMTEPEITAWFDASDDSPRAIEIIEQSVLGSKQRAVWFIKIAKQKFSEMLGKYLR